MVQFMYDLQVGALSRDIYRPVMSLHNQITLVQHDMKGLCLGLNMLFMRCASSE